MIVKVLILFVSKLIKNFLISLVSNLMQFMTIVQKDVWNSHLASRGELAGGPAASQLGRTFAPDSTRK